jgi:hypothetical protein
MVLQPDGKIVAIGSGLGDFAVTRYLSGLIIGTIELSTVQDVLFYPNPVHELETLEYNLEQDEIMTIALFDVSGQLCKVFVSQDNRSRGTHRETLWFGNHMIPGIYFLHISTSSGSMSIKIIKQ